jgi:hypothetical protein
MAKYSLKSDQSKKKKVIKQKQKQTVTQNVKVVIGEKPKRGRQPRQTRPKQQIQPRQQPVVVTTSIQAPQQSTEGFASLFKSFLKSQTPVPSPTLSIIPEVKVEKEVVENELEKTKRKKREEEIEVINPLEEKIIEGSGISTPLNIFKGPIPETPLSGLTSGIATPQLIGGLTSGIATPNWEQFKRDFSKTLTEKDEQKQYNRLIQASRNVSLLDQFDQPEIALETASILSERSPSQNIGLKTPQEFLPESAFRPIQVEGSGIVPEIFQQVRPRYRSALKQIGIKSPPFELSPLEQQRLKELEAIESQVVRTTSLLGELPSLLRQPFTFGLLETAEELFRDETKQPEAELEVGFAPITPQLFEQKPTPKLVGSEQQTLGFSVGEEVGQLPQGQLPVEPYEPVLEPDFIDESPLVTPAEAQSGITELNLPEETKLAEAVELPPQPTYQGFLPPVEQESSILNQPQLATPLIQLLNPPKGESLAGQAQAELVKRSDSKFYQDLARQYNISLNDAKGSTKNKATLKAEITKKGLEKDPNFVLPVRPKEIEKQLGRPKGTKATPIKGTPAGSTEI